MSLWFNDDAGKRIGPLLIKAEGKGDPMERNSQNPIKINLIDELSNITKVEVVQDGKKMADDWHLDSIELTQVDLVTEEPLGEPISYPFKRWIKGKVTILVFMFTRQSPNWIIEFKTTDRQRNGTEGYGTGMQI